MTPRRVGAAVVAGAVLGLALVACARGASRGAQATGQQGRPAPDFTLTDQFGHLRQLSDFRGRPVLLTFIDSRCTTLCPLTAELLRKAVQFLGPHQPVQLLAVNANPEYTSVAAVRRWSARHGMLHRWLFLTGPAVDLRLVWSRYGIAARVVRGDVQHTALVFLIDPAGRERAVFPIATQRRSLTEEAAYIAGAVRQVARAG
jgi:cytochrome oxidase Cu insertion factor (SCO1/SenC/PrrC family)